MIFPDEHDLGQRLTGKKSHADLHLHLAMHRLCNQPLRQQLIVEIIEPHFLHHITSHLLVPPLIPVLQNNHPQSFGITHQKSTCHPYYAWKDLVSCRKCKFFDIIVKTFFLIESGMPKRRGAAPRAERCGVHRGDSQHPLASFAYFAMGQSMDGVWGVSAHEKVC